MESLKTFFKIESETWVPCGNETWQLKIPYTWGLAGKSSIEGKNPLPCLITRGQILDRWFNIICWYSRIALEKTGGYVLASQQMQGVEDWPGNMFFRHGLGYLSENATILGNIWPI